MRLGILAACCAVLGVGACGEVVSAPAQGETTLRLVPRWPAAVMANAVFGAGIDTVQVSVSSLSESFFVDSIIPFPASMEGLRISIGVPLLQRPETATVYISMREAGLTVYNGQSTVVLRPGTVPSMPAIPLTYIGPGYDAVSVTVTPRGGPALPTDTIFFTAVAQDGQQAVVASPIAWSLSDSSLAHIDATGRFIGRGRTGSVRVRATTPTAIADSVTVNLSPLVP